MGKTKRSAKRETTTKVRVRLPRSSRRARRRREVAQACCRARACKVCSSIAWLMGLLLDVQSASFVVDKAVGEPHRDQGQHEGNDEQDPCHRRGVAHVEVLE